jgi:hypothetical protein
MLAEHEICASTDYVLIIANIGSTLGREEVSSPVYPDQHWETTEIFSIRTGQIFSRIKRTGCLPDLSAPSSAEARNKWSYISKPPRFFNAFRQKKLPFGFLYTSQNCNTSQEYVKCYNM